MIDSFGRTINYLRVSVTDRCNLRCIYCRPAEGVKLIPHDDILRYEEILDFVRVAVDRGICKVRVTGGEPLVRRNIPSLIERLAAIDGVEDLCMTTNGTLLDRFAGPLADAGLQRVNISLDTLSPERYASITRGGDVRAVLDGIEAAQTAGLLPIKVNCVVKQSSDEPDARAVRAYGLSKGLEVRFIRRMNIAAGAFWPVEGGLGGHCEKCNRLRLSSDGWLRPCLFNDIGFNVRELGYVESLERAVAAKPESGTSSLSNRMYEIGG